MSDAPSPVTVLAYISGLVMAAAVYLGDQADPVTGVRTVNLTAAGHAIDVLSMLQERTKGNLSAEERQFLEQAVYELRLKYVEAAGKKDRGAGLITP